MRLRIFPPSALAALSLLLSAAGPARAQTYDVVGLVVDGERGEPVGGVEIRTLEGAKLGVSQSTGRFEVTVNNRRAHIQFRRQGYKDLEVDLGDVPELIDVEITLESAVQELTEITTYAAQHGHDPSQAQTLEELELMQGMRMDLNDHLRQLHGVAGMNEFTSDISVYGSRSRDVTHYLGKSRIPSLRHLDFGFPGNESVLNPRLLKSVTVADNLAKGPLNQGNASALVYDLREGDPEALHGDLILGTSNREANLTGYWGERTYLTSFRMLDPNSLGNLGGNFFTSPKDARLRRGGAACDSTQGCKNLTDPLQLNSLDMFLGTFKRDSSGAFGRHSLIYLNDDYTIDQDVGQNATDAVAQQLVKGFQGAWLYSYEAVNPSPSGDWEWGLSLLNRTFSDAYRDTLAWTNDVSNALPWYPVNQTIVLNDLGDLHRQDLQAILSGQWSPAARAFGAQTTYGVELDYFRQRRRFTDIRSGFNSDTTLKRDLVQGNAEYKLHWGLPGQRAWDAAIGVLLANDGPFQGDEGGLLPPLPLASLRYSHPLAKDHKVYGEVAVRQSAAFEPDGLNRLVAKPSSSAEFKFGGDGAFGNPFRYAWSGYTRWYKDPALPAPEVFWNYAETHSADFAYVDGANASLNFLPSHHVGLGINASVIQGDYHLDDGSYLPWESNRTLDLVSNLRVLPRSDSLISLILTYGINNGAPLYEYRGLWDTTGQAVGLDHSTGTRTVSQNSRYPEVSRQRLDIRVNLDLKSRWRPLESMRFFFEADNLFADYDGTAVSWLGGVNQRRRGWTRANATGNLEPVVTRGLGLFIMFGLEGKLKI